jgi:RES domain-containing protein
LKAYRLFAPRFDPKDASGARRFGGRWNSPGTAVLYAASSLALACLETLVHLRDVTSMPILAWVEVLMPDETVIPWREDRERTQALVRSPALSAVFGDLFVHRKANVAAQVPSVVIESEWNYVLDRTHPEFDLIGWGEPRPFTFDPRLLDPGLR